MFTLLFSLQDCFRSRAVLQAEILALRHQLLIFERSSRGHNLRLRWTDRALWVWLSRLWNDWRSALLMVKPETVIAWHRRGFRLYWGWKSRHRHGRPAVSLEVRNLIRQMSLANPRWGAPLIHGELLRIGIEVCQATVAKYMARHPATSLPDMANLSQKSHQGPGFLRFLRRAHHHVPAPVHARDSQP
jgi:putative transposase